jgi:hypothetical protein
MLSLEMLRHVRSASRASKQGEVRFLSQDASQDLLS